MAETLEVIITVKGNAEKEFDKAQKGLTKMSDAVGVLSPKMAFGMKSVGGLADSFKTLAPAMGMSAEAAAGMATQAMALAGPIGAILAVVGAAVVAFTGLAKVVGFAMEEAKNAQIIEAQLGAVIKSTGGVAGMTAEMIQDMASDLSAMSGVEDDLIVKSSNLLLTFKHIGKDVFPQAQLAALDLSQAFGMDLASASIMLGKALEDPRTGMTALRRVGVSFSEGMIQAAQSMVEHGQVARAQALILDEVSKQVAGSAAAMGSTVAGEQNKISNLLKNMAEDFGKAFQPLQGDLLVIVREFLTQVTHALQPAMALLRNEVRQFQTAMRDPEMRAAINGLITSMAALIGENAIMGVRALASGMRTFADIMQRDGPAILNIVSNIVSTFALLANTINRVLDAWASVRTTLSGMSFAQAMGGQRLPGYAEGTSYHPGGMAWVGERGPELVNLPRGSSVTPASQVSAASGGFKNYGVNNFYVNNDTTLASLLQQWEAAATATA